MILPLPLLLAGLYVCSSTGEGKGPGGDLAITSRPRPQSPMGISGKRKNFSVPEKTAKPVRPLAADPPARLSRLRAPPSLVDSSVRPRVIATMHDQWFDPPPPSAHRRAMRNASWLCRPMDPRLSLHEGGFITEDLLRWGGIADRTKGNAALRGWRTAVAVTRAVVRLKGMAKRAKSRVQEKKFKRRRREKAAITIQYVLELTGH